jgi:hypothetical protein
VRSADGSLEPHQSLFVHFVSAKQVCVVSEITKEPVEPPESFRSAIQPPRNMAGARFLWFEHDKADQVARLLRMPPVIHVVHASQEQSFEEILRVLGLGMEAGDMSLHDFTASATP